MSRMAATRLPSAIKQRLSHIDFKDKERVQQRSLLWLDFAREPRASPCRQIPSLPTKLTRNLHTTCPKSALGQVAHETSHSSEVMSKEFSFFHTISKYNIQILSLHWSVSQDLFCKSIASWLQKDSRLGKDRIHLGWLPEVLLFEQEEKAEGINTIIQSTFSLSLGQNFWVCLAAFA